MAVCIGEVSLSRNPVYAKEALIISVTIKNHQYLKRYRYSELKQYTNRQRREMGCYRASEHKKLAKYRYGELRQYTYLRIREKGDTW